MVDERQVRRKYQIHDGTFGRALYERTSGREALLDYVADRVRGETVVQTDEDGRAYVEMDGVRLTAREIHDEG